MTKTDLTDPRSQVITFEEAPTYQLLTGWLCSICYEPAQVQCSGETMCLTHAKRWSHGYGESIKALKEELAH